MTSEDPLASLIAAVEARPDDVLLRLHLARVLIEAGRRDEAVRQCAAALQREPGNRDALAMLQGAVGQPVTDGPGSVPDTAASSFDWRAAEAEVGDLAPPMFVDGDDGAVPVDTVDAERPRVRLADVGGMEQVKARLEAAFLAPIRHPELRAAFAKSLKGGLLLYGPPGCGKTFLARAIAGELGVHFVALHFDEVLDMYVGQSERNLHEIFQTARRHAPCVLFLDEVDAIGQKRTQLRNNAMRSTVNQLLAELDDAEGRNEGVFVLAATNMPWDVDPALRRPGRLDRTLLVLPPDETARDHILRHNLAGRPVANIDTKKLAKMTDGYSGADLAHICETAAEKALLDSARTGQIRFITMDDLRAATGEVKPSIRPWMQIARNVAMFANEGGEYDELLAYMRHQRLA
ncbi:MAG: AAA family ATPase [Jatrophihabitans sp.]|uniref:ATP-binding protein n=1 Tax=Jatrophihabitans sp. TaxID=1932789 RepID=UPI003F8015C8